MFNFKERFDQLYKESGKNQEDFGAFLGMSRSMVYHYRSGAGQPNAELLAKIADKCDVSMDWLAGRSNIRTPIDTVAAHRSDSDTLDLPPEAIASIEAFKKEIRKIYGKK